jgi:hypothetical protein
MFIILVIVIGLVAWSLHLMQEAVDNQEFALMLAGTLVATAAAAMVAVYFLMGGYVGYLAEATQQSYVPYESQQWDYVSLVSQWDNLDNESAAYPITEASSSVSLSK